MASNVVLSTNFNTQKCSFSQLRVLDSGGKQAYMNYDGGMFVFQTPNCTLPYGMSAFDKAGPVKYSVELSMRGYDEAGSKMAQFHEALTRLDDYMIDQGVKNSKQWFKTELSRDVIKAFYSPVIRIPLDKDGNRKPYPPTIKTSLRQKRDSQDFDVQCYDDKKQMYRGIPLEELLVKGAQVTCLIQCTGVWFAGSKYGISWKLVQALVTSLPQNARGFTFIEDGESSASASSSAPVQRRSTVTAPAVLPNAVEEEEEEEEDEVFQAPVAAVRQGSKSAPVAAPVAMDEEDEEADDVEPVPVPKKVVTKKKIVTVAKK
jgi:hypothetical protein